MSITNVHTTVDFFIKVKKLKIKRANTLIMTKSRKKALKEEAEGLSQELDSAIISLAHDRFAIRQDQSLRKLAERRAELDAFIPTLDTGDSVDLKKGISEKISNLVKDKKYGHIDDVYEILKTSGANIENPKKKEDKEEKKKEPEKNILSEVLFSPEISDEQLNENNKKIYEFLLASGNEPAADYVLDLLTRPEITAKDVNGLAANTLELKKLSEINNKILQKLLEIEESMVDEQDTSVDLPKKEERPQAVALGVNKSTPGIEKVEGGFGIGLDDVIAGLMAGGLTKKLAGMFSFGKNKTPDADNGKRPKKVSGEIKKPDAKKPDSTDAKKTSGKNKSGKILRKMTKLAKFVPFVGTVIAGGTAIYNAVEGYNSAPDILEKPEKELSEAEKIAAATGFVVQEFTSIPWVSDGIPAKETAETLIDFANDIFPTEDTTSEKDIAQIKARKGEIQKQVDAIKPDVIKEKSMIEVEEGYIETVNQTRNYDVKKSSYANNSASNVSINTVTASNTQETINSFELFDK